MSKWNVEMEQVVELDPIIFFGGIICISEPFLSIWPCKCPQLYVHNGSPFHEFIANKAHVVQMIHILSASISYLPQTLDANTAEHCVLCLL